MSKVAAEHNRKDNKVKMTKKEKSKQNDCTPLNRIMLYLIRYILFPKQTKKFKVMAVPCNKLRKAYVMKMLRTLLKTSPSNIEVTDPEGLHAIIIIA